MPSLEERRAPKEDDPRTKGGPEPPPGAEAPARPDPFGEILAPAPVSLRIERGTAWGRPVQATVGLTAGALWVQETWQLRQIALSTLAGLEAQRGGRELILALGPDPSGGRLRLTFASTAEGARWHRELQARLQAGAGAPPEDRRRPEGVALMRRPPAVPHEVLGRVAFTERSAAKADRGLQLRAGVRGADAVIDVKRLKCAELGPGARSVSGLAIRVEDAADRLRLRYRWYAEAVAGLTCRMLLLLAVQAALLFVGAAFVAGGLGLELPTRQAPSEAAASAAWGVGLLYTWPLLLLALLWVLRGPQLLRAAGLAVLAGTTGRDLAVWLAHLLAVGTTGAALEDSKLWLLLDPFDWAFALLGVVLCVRAWRLAGAAADILPPEAQVVSPARRAWGRGVLALTGVYALVLLGFAGTARYRASAYLLQPGVDLGREQQAALALDQGVALYNRGELKPSEQALQRSLRLWEELAPGRSAPPVYRRDLAVTLNDLGLVCQQQGRPDEAEKYYARAVALADELAGSPGPDGRFTRVMAHARAALADLRGAKVAQGLDEKDEAASRKYEEGQVQAAKGSAGAAGLFREAIAAWEEILPQATSASYRREAVARLATAYLRLGDFQQQLGKRAEAEESFKKAVDYGEKAVAQEPNRPLARHNLELARQALDGLREQALQEEINRLCAARRFRDAAELCRRSIAGWEEQVRAGKDRDAAEQRLAYRLDRFAWFLAHCPDEDVRDTKAAVKQANRATQLQPAVTDYWFTLAMTQYRNGDWRDSLASLERIRTREGGFDASAWFLVAMDRQRLGEKEEARVALRRAHEWITELRRKAEGNAVLEFQYEMLRPSLDALRQEAENLIEGGDAGRRATG